MKRVNNGKPVDHQMTRRIMGTLSKIAGWFPRFAAFAGETFAAKRMRKSFPKIDPAWRLLPAPPIKSSPGVMNEEIISKFAAGEVLSLPGIKRFTEYGIDTDDGDHIKAEAVIFATGYNFDYSILSPEADPTFITPDWQKAKYRNGLTYPRLFMTYFSTKFPLSLAFVGPCKGFSISAYANGELASQAIAQVWKGSYHLPPQQEMERWCDENYRMSLEEIRRYRVAKTGAAADEQERWLNDAVGNEMNEMLGWGWKGWKFWWNERELYNLMMNGISTPFAYRLFEGRPGTRLKWDGAKNAIYLANKKTPPSR